MTLRFVVSHLPRTSASWLLRSFIGPPTSASGQYTGALPQTLKCWQAAVNLTFCLGQAENQGDSYLTVAFIRPSSASLVRTLLTMIPSCIRLRQACLPECMLLQTARAVGTTAGISLIWAFLVAIDNTVHVSRTTDSGVLRSASRGDSGTYKSAFRA